MIWTIWEERVWSQKELGLSHFAVICFLILLCSTCHPFLCHTLCFRVLWPYSPSIFIIFSLLEIIACKSDYWEVFINCLLHPLNYPPILPSLFKNVLPKLPEDMKVPCYATKRQKYISGRINTQRKGLEEFEGWGPPAAGVCTTGVTVGIWHTSFIFCMWAWAYLISEWISFSCAGGSSDTATAQWCRVHQVLEKVEML